MSCPVCMFRNKATLMHLHVICELLCVVIRRIYSVRVLLFLSSNMSNRMYRLGMQIFRTCLTIVDGVDLIYFFQISPVAFYLCPLFCSVSFTFFLVQATSRMRMFVEDGQTLLRWLSGERQLSGFSLPWMVCI